MDKDAPFKLMVTGGRDYANQIQCWTALDKLHQLHEIDIIIHGDAEGADKMADAWARVKGIQRAVCPACWAHFDPSVAGHRRNRFMLELGPHLVVAFPGGAGTANAVTQAQHRGVKVMDLRKIK